MQVDPSSAAQQDVRLSAGAVRALAGTGTLLLMAAIVLLVLGGGGHGVDARILLSLREAHDTGNPLGPAWFESMMRDFTALGSTGVLVIVLALCIGVLWLRRHRSLLVWLVGVAIGGQVLSWILKWLVHRPRPELVAHIARVYTYSFPSGHALMSTVIYLAAALVLGAGDTRLRGFLLVCAVAMSTLIGLSRVYLGVHWPSDVLTGWGLGMLWVLLMQRLLTRRWFARSVNPPRPAA